MWRLKTVKKLPSKVLVTLGLYCKILTWYKIIKLIQCTTNAWLLLRFLSFRSIFFLSTKTQTVVMFGHTGNVSFWG